MRRLMTTAALLALAACEPGTNNATAVNATAPVENAANVAEAPVNATDAPAPAAAPAMTLASDGISLVDAATGSARMIAFDTAQADAIAAFTGAGQTPGALSRNEECGGGPMEMADLPNGLQLTFMGGKFVGWTAPNAIRGANDSLKTASGIGVGSTRQALEAAYTVTIEDSTLGVEFSASEMFGLLESKAPTAKITNLWAGDTCIFR